MTNFIKTTRTNKNKPQNNCDLTKSDQFKTDHDSLKRERKNARKAKNFLKSL